MSEQIQIEKWVASILSNDEYSSDEELIEHFISQGATKEEAEYYITKRSYYLNNIVMDDGSIFKPLLKK